MPDSKNLEYQLAVMSDCVAWLGLVHAKSIGIEKISDAYYQYAEQCPNKHVAQMFKITADRFKLLGR